MALKVPELYYVGNIDTNFIGFTFNGIHCFELGVIRVSEGSRYEDNLLPSFKDQTLEAPGRDGTYYFKKNYSQKEIKLSFAFDRVTEQQLRKIKQWFNVDSPKKLIFDEFPYKYYLVKPKTAPTIKYLCFEERKDQRVYKGEGTVQLVSYFPYAFSCVLDYENDYFDYTGNRIEWQDASGLVKRYNPNWPLNSSKELSNGGDFPTPLNIIITPSKTSGINFSCSLNNDKFLISDLKMKENDTAIRINSRTQLVEGGHGNAQLFTATGNIYNEYIEGIFPILPINESGKSFISCNNLKNISKLEVIYDLLYL